MKAQLWFLQKLGMGRWPPSALELRAEQFTTERSSRRAESPHILKVMGSVISESLANVKSSLPGSMRALSGDYKQDNSRVRMIVAGQAVLDASVAGRSRRKEARRFSTPSTAGRPMRLFAWISVVLLALNTRSW
jgi:hypothetical protein